jgi:hypothetical protein
MAVKGKKNKAMPTGEVFVLEMAFNFNQACYIHLYQVGHASQQPDVKRS